MTDEHHSTEDDLIQHRRDKLERIRARGDNPFKYAFARSHTLAQACSDYEAAESEDTSEEGVKLPASVAGRINESGSR